MGREIDDRGLTIAWRMIVGAYSEGGSGRPIVSTKPTTINNTYVRHSDRSTSGYKQAISVEEEELCEKPFRVISQLVLGCPNEGQSRVRPIPFKKKKTFDSTLKLNTSLINRILPKKRNK